MADVHSKETRSYNMSQIKSKHTKPELVVRKFLFSKGFRYRLHVKTLPNQPDIVLPKYKTVIFVHGCFWHGHENCKYFVIPKTRTEWWSNKIFMNKQNDDKALISINDAGWKVIILWECQLRKNKIEQTFTNLLEQILSLD